MSKLKILLIGLIAVIFAACESSESQLITYKINEPVFMSKTAFRSSIKVTTKAQDIKNYGKICFYQDYLYISESGKGIHVIDNRNPSNPQNVGFIELLGNADLSVRNNLLYADSYVDLVWFDISTPASPVLKDRLVDVFPKAIPIMLNQYGFDYEDCYVEGKDSVIVGWNVVEKTEEMKDYHGNYWGWGGGFFDDRFVMMDAASPSANSNGINGSMSRFSLYDNKLYVVLENNMTIFDLAGTNPVKVKESIYVGRNVETIFSYKDNLFMGTPTGMLIYSVKNPYTPEYMSSISHAFGCDPVVVDNDLAYVTVHSGNNCGQNTNELFIVDVKDVKNPKELVSFKTLVSPKGLGIDAGKLFLCDDGLKIFRITDSPSSLLTNLIKHVPGMAGYDLIPYNNTLMMIAEDGLYQYDYTDTNNIRQISKLSFVK